MNLPKKQLSVSRALSLQESRNERSGEGAPATLGQKIFVIGLYLYLLSLVWLTLSHHWYGVLPKWLDPQ